MNEYEQTRTCQDCDRRIWSRGPRCSACQSRHESARSATYYAANRDQILERKRLYRAANRERINAQARADYASKMFGGKT